MSWEKLKNDGNDLLKKGDNEGAIKRYTEALESLEESDASNRKILFSNRSAAYLKCLNTEQALKDAEECIKIAPSWSRGYGRKAAVLKELKLYDDAIKTAEAGLEVEPSNVALQTIKHGCEKTIVCDKLKGFWHGVVAEDVGGYMQTFEFLNESDANVMVLGTTVRAQFELNCNGVPFPHLDMSFPDSPGAAYVRHIYKFGQNEDELILCSPYMRPPEERPTEFKGPGMVVMKRGQYLPSEAEQKEKEELLAKSVEERVQLFLERSIEAVPNFDVRPQESESDAEIGKKLTANVKFQTFYQGLIEKLGPDAETRVKELVVGIRPLQSETPEVQALALKFKKKMIDSGLISDEENAEKPKSSEVNSMIGVPPDEAMKDKSSISRYVAGSDEPFAPIDETILKPVKSNEKVPIQKPTPASAAASSSSSTDYTPIVLTLVIATTALALGAALYFNRRSNE